MKKAVLTLLMLTAIGFSPAASAQTDEQADLDALYQQIDEAILQSPQYVAERRRQIGVNTGRLKVETTAEGCLLIAEELFDLYKPYRNDSALYYAELCISLADSLHRPDIAGHFRSMLAYQCSNADLFTESLEQLRLVNKSVLDTTGLVNYYNAWMHVYGELGSYTQRKDVRQKYYDLQNLYRDSVLMVTKEGSDEWFHLKMDVLSGRRLYQDALALSDQWLQRADDHTHESAFAAFYRSMVYSNLSNHDMTCYWLGKSALDDIQCAVMDQASLLFLAEHLADDGDFSRARRYAAFAKECNLAFCPRLRAYQVPSVVRVLEKSSQASLSRSNLIMWAASAVITLLLITLIIIIYRRTKS